MSNNIIINDQDTITIKSRNGNYEISFIKLKETIIEHLKENINIEKNKLIDKAEIKVKTIDKIINYLKFKFKI